MKQIIKGKTYNTENACCMGHKYTQIGECEWEIKFCDLLYQKRNGEYFRYVRKYKWENIWDKKGNCEDKTTLIKEWIEPLTGSDVDVWWIV